MRKCDEDMLIMKNCLLLLSIKVRFIMGIFNFFLHLTFEIFVSTTNVTSSSSYFLRSALYASSKSRKNFHSFYVLFSIPLHSAEIAA